MALEVGSRHGHYDVTALLGEGGMGQVWQATDTQLGREVALKILPDAFAADPDRLARFKREAQILASLNHPNIAAIHGIEEAEGTRALVLELVEGPTLADRIAKGPIPLDEALPIAKQIAEALEAAHEAGVIHRDLKPANIKVREDGTVKVLDFGLAKALEPNPEGDPSQSPTLTAAATQMGVIMGTAAYMSPEQARGKRVDKRADIWAFGCVLFEMLTGKHAFQGRDVSETLAAVIKSEPPWEAFAADTPATLDALLRRCLEKEPKRRMRDIGDVRRVMDGRFETTVSPPRNGAATPVAGDRRAIPAALSFLAGGVVVGLVAWGLLRSEPLSLDPTRFALSVATSGGHLNGEIALSPDGRTLVFLAPSGEAEVLYKHLFDRLEPIPIDGTEGAEFPFFSPDGRWLGFFQDQALKKILLAGGPPTTVAQLERGQRRGASWGSDDTIVFSEVSGTGMNYSLRRVPAAGGEPEPLPVTLDQGEEGVVAYPALLPGDGGALVTLRRQGLGRRDPRVAVYSFGSSQGSVQLWPV